MTLMRFSQTYVDAMILRLVSTKYFVHNLLVTHYDLVLPYGDIDLGQNSFR